MSYSFFFRACSIMSLLMASGCGYSFQNSSSSILLKHGIRKIYVAPIVNNTYKAGIENMVFNELSRTLVASGRVKVVQNRADADAVLTGSVGTASYTASAATNVSGLNPTNVGSSLPTATYPIATEYVATLGCSFSLTAKAEEVKPVKPAVQTKRESSHSGLSTHSGTSKDSISASPTSKKKRHDLLVAKKKPYDWSSGFSRTKTFPGSNQLDVPGTTSALINDSEFERALSDLVHSMMMDVSESMMDMF